MIYVVKDQNNHFVRRDCFKKIDGDNLYISYRTFSEECRGYIGFEACNDVLKALELKIGNIGLDVRFGVSEVDLDEVILIHNEFVGSGRVDNMVIIDLDEVGLVWE